jgi:hypothetical protein
MNQTIPRGILSLAPATTRGIASEHRMGAVAKLRRRKSKQPRGDWVYQVSPWFTRVYHLNMFQSKDLKRLIRELSIVKTCIKTRPPEP